MRELTGLFRSQQSARVAVDALREAGFSAAIIDRPKEVTNLQLLQRRAVSKEFGVVLDEIDEQLFPVHLNVVYPYADTVERILKTKGALTVEKQADAPFA